MGLGILCEQGNKVGRTNIGKKIWINIGWGDKGRQVPQGRVLVLKAPYKHQEGREAWPMDPPYPWSHRTNT